MNRMLRKRAAALIRLVLLPALCLTPLVSQANSPDKPVFPAVASMKNNVLAGMVYASATQVAQALADERFTSQELVSYLISRAADLDSFGPAIEAVIEFNPEALSIARTLDEERQAGSLRGPLHGIPVLLKDNLHTAD